MSDLLGFLIGYGIPIGAALAGMIAIVLAMGVALAWPRYIVLGYVTILMLFPQTSSYGLLDATDATIVY